MLLSGGLDSRLVAAYARRDGVDLRALTQGRRGEGEVRVASRVARALGIDQTVVDVPSDEYPALAATHLELEQLACGFNGVHNWGLSTRMSALPPFLLTGYVMGAVFEVCDKTWSDSGVPEAPTFEWSFRNRNRWGLTPDTVRRLVRDPDVAREIDNVVDFLREDFDAGGGRASHRARVFGLRNRYRFHPGNHLWHLAFSRWPLLPGVDREVLETVAAMPQTVMYYRHLEKQVLVREFPDLARLPLDRNSWNFTPLVPTLKWLVGDAARRTAAGWLRRDPARALYYYRIYDFNGPGWRAIRERAEPLRRLGEELFSRDALLELLPPPDRRVETRDGIVESSGRKTLVGVLLWLKDNG
jgi:asparagine synthase (glutamine-hydrolysing)